MPRSQRPHILKDSLQRASLYPGHIETDGVGVCFRENGDEKLIQHFEDRVDMLFFKKTGCSYVNNGAVNNPHPYRETAQFSKPAVMRNNAR